MVNFVAGQCRPYFETEFQVGVAVEGCTAVLWRRFAMFSLGKRRRAVGGVFLALGVKDPNHLRSEMLVTRTKISNKICPLTMLPPAPDFTIQYKFELFQRRQVHTLAPLPVRESDENGLTGYGQFYSTEEGMKIPACFYDSVCLCCGTRIKNRDGRCGNKSNENQRRPRSRSRGLWQPRARQSITAALRKACCCGGMLCSEATRSSRFRIKRGVLDLDSRYREILRTSKARSGLGRGARSRWSAFDLCNNGENSRLGTGTLIGNVVLKGAHRYCGACRSKSL